MRSAVVVRRGASTRPLPIVWRGIEIAIQRWQAAVVRARAESARDIVLTFRAGRPVNSAGPDSLARGQFAVPRQITFRQAINHSINASQAVSHQAVDFGNQAPCFRTIDHRAADRQTIGVQAVHPSGLGEVLVANAAGSLELTAWYPYSAVATDGAAHGDALFSQILTSVAGTLGVPTTRSWRHLDATCRRSTSFGIQCRIQFFAGSDPVANPVASRYARRTFSAIGEPSACQYGDDTEHCEAGANCTEPDRGPSAHQHGDDTAYCEAGADGPERDHGPPTLGQIDPANIEQRVVQVAGDLPPPFGTAATAIVEFADQAGHARPGRSGWSVGRQTDQWLQPLSIVSRSRFAA